MKLTKRMKLCKEEDVMVDLTGYNELTLFCHMDGKVVTRHRDNTVSVKLNETGAIVRRKRSMITTKKKQQQRKTNWQFGDKVQIREQNDGIFAWWDATIIKQVTEITWEVQWKGQYEEHGEFSVVSHKNIV